MNRWVSRVIDDLYEQKKAGAKDFGLAWSRATGRNPAKGRDLGEERPTLFIVDGSSPTDDRAESMHDFLYRVARDAWEGHNPRLIHLSPDLAAELDGEYSLSTRVA